MSSVERDFLSDELHPIDIVETLAEHHAWDFDRIAEDQIAMAIEGNWRTYSLTLAWSAHDDTLRLICAFDMTPPEERLPEFFAALDRANGMCWAGGFTLWRDQGLVAYRYGLVLAGGATASSEQVAEMVRRAVGASERFLPAFQLVCWGDTPADEAMSIAMNDAYGRA